jgi:hypothetical protein
MGTIWRSLHFDPGYRHLRAAVLTMIATLLSFWSVRELRNTAGLGLDLVVLAVALGITLSRIESGRIRSSPSGTGNLLDWATGAAVLAVAAVAASEVGSLFIRYADLGDALFVLAIGGSIWVRRFGPRFTAAGTLATLPFIATLVTPLPQPSTGRYLLWSALVALIAFGWVGIVYAAASPAGATRRTRPPATAAIARPPRSGLARLAPSTRLAAQMAVALAAAFVVGRTVFPAHWVWPVLTAFIVSSGNRGRADVIYKGALRMVGALAGTVAATVLFVGMFSPGNDASIVAIFLILALATWLRPVSYAYWAGCVTAALAFLYGYFGQTGTDLLRIRLEGILYGGLVAIAACWFVLPLRTADVLRLRRAEALAVLTDFLTAARDGSPELDRHRARFDHAVTRLGQVAPPLRALRLLTRRWRSRPHQADSLDAIQRCAAPVHTIAECAAADPGVLRQPEVARRTAAVSAGLIALRRAMAGSTAPTQPAASTMDSTMDSTAGSTVDDEAPAGPAGTAVDELHAAVRTLAGIQRHAADVLPPAQAPGGRSR